MSARVCNAIVGASVVITIPLFVWACSAAYADRECFAIGGEAGVLLLPLIVYAIISLWEE